MTDASIHAAAPPALLQAIVGQKERHAVEVEGEDKPARVADGLCRPLFSGRRTA